ncbi:hypothetical protein [Dokdonia sp.]|uniref:hypothetical protein n=1 Tax=Dokdonia sp. TaxID=2024995 RepID=UPI00326697CA
MSTIDTLDILDSIKKRGVTESKKKELDAMTSKVLEAQNKVEEIQAVVTSLTSKASTIKAELATRDGNKTKALSNKDLLDTVVDQVTELNNNSKIVGLEIKESNLKIKHVALDTKELIDKLIYSAEVINKLSNLVVREKAINPLVSDELVTMVATAGTNANSAVALTLVALNAVFTSQANTIESEAIVILENFQAEKLFEFMTQEDPNGKDDGLPKTNIKTLIDKMYDDSLVLYASALDANNDITKQLSNATADLERAKMQLSSLEAGLAAANAASLAS